MKTGSYRWERVNEWDQFYALHHGAAAWDQMNLWGINPNAPPARLAPGVPRRSFMAGGSDAHGDLNFRREGAITGWDNAVDTALGKPRNLVYVGARGRRPSTAARPSASRRSSRPSQRATSRSPTARRPYRHRPEQQRHHRRPDIPMGGVLTLPARGRHVPLLVEWRSTPEFGPVGSIDLYVGTQAGTSDGIVYAPDGHGPLRATAQPAMNGPGGTYKISDRYWADRTGKLPRRPSSYEGLAGTRKIVFNRADYPLVSTGCHTEYNIIPAECDEVAHYTSRSRSRIRCATSPSTTLPSRNFIRAFARASVAAPAGAPGTNPTISRFGYSNPVWVMPWRPLYTLPTLPIGVLGQ